MQNKYKKWYNCINRTSNNCSEFIRCAQNAVGGRSKKKLSARDSKEGKNKVPPQYINSHLHHSYCCEIEYNFKVKLSLTLEVDIASCSQI